jgi:dUTP pyrophosphatase
VIPGKGKVVVPTDISLAIPDGHYGRVAPRSGLASKHFLDTGAGVIDADYRGPLGILMFNFSDVDYEGTYIYKDRNRVVSLNTLYS